MRTEEGRYFDRGFLGGRARLRQCLEHVYLEKRWRDGLLYTTIFKRVLDFIQIKIGHLNGDNKWECSGSLDSNELVVEGSTLLRRTN